MGVFCKKMENGRVFFVKKWTFPQRMVHYVQYQYFLFYILLICGGGRVHTHPARPRWPPCLRTCFRLFSPPVNRIMIHDAVLKFSRLRIGRLTSKTASNQNGHRPKRPQSDHKATTKRYFFFAFAWTHDAMIANSPTSSSSHDTDTVRCCYNL